MVTAAGGTGIAVRVDHTVEAEVEALFARVARDHGRLDVLVNSIAGEDPILGGWGAFWQTDFTRGADALRQALLSHLITAKHAAPLHDRSGAAASSSRSPKATPCLAAAATRWPMS